MLFRSLLTQAMQGLVFAGGSNPTLEAELDALKKKVKEELEPALRKAQEDVNNLTIQLGQKEQEITNLTNDVNTKQEDLEQAIKDKRIIEQNLRDANVQLASLTTRLQTAQSRVDELEKEIVRLKQESAAAKDERDKAKQELEQLKNTTPAPIPTPLSPTLQVGDKIDVNGVLYRVTNATKKEAQAYGVSNKSLSYARVKAAVKIKGVKCKVTSVADKAFANLKKLRKAVIGQNVKTIGQKVFYGDRNLKNLTIRGKVTKVGNKALKGISAKAVIYVPKGKIKTFANLLKDKGQKKSVKIKVEPMNKE